MRSPSVSLCACGPDAEVCCYTTHLLCPLVQVSDVTCVLTCRLQLSRTFRRLSAVGHEHPSRTSRVARTVRALHTRIGFVWRVHVLEWRHRIRYGVAVAVLCTNLTLPFHTAGDKSNHVPVLHVPQLYYFIAFATLMGWPAVIFGRGGPVKLVNEVIRRMFGTKRFVCLDKGGKPLIP